MSFVYPNFLWAFFVLLVPIIVHLFNFRRYKTIYFSRVQFLQEVVEDSKSGTRLKHLLVLFSRLLALSCLVLAFAQPYIPATEGKQTENITSIYIDNSYSMQAEGKDGDLLNEVKNQALEIVNSLPENERINLLTTDLESIHQRFYTKTEINDLVKQIDYSAKTTNLETILRLQTDLFNANEYTGNKRIFLLSDFQQTSHELTALNQPEIATQFYRAEAVQPANIFIDSVWFETPVHRINSPGELHFRIQNQTNQDISDLTVQLSVNNNEPAPKRVSIPAGSYATDYIVFTDRTTGNKQGKLSIRTDQLFFDDDFYFSYTIKEEVTILLVKNSTNDGYNLEQLYALDPYYNATTTTIDAVVPEDFKNKELIILQNINQIPSGIAELLDNSLKNGSTVILIPGEKPERTNWNNYLGRHQLPQLGTKDTTTLSLNYFNDADPLYTGVFDGKPENYAHPQLFQHYPLSTNSSQNFITLFGANSQQPYLLYQKEENGRLVLLSSPLAETFTNYQNHALFAATFLRLAETASFQRPLFMSIGSMDNFPVQQPIDDKSPIHLKNETLQIDVIPQLINMNNTRFINFSHLENTLKSSGFYALTDSKDFSEELALNYNRAESNITALKNDEIITQFAQAGWEQVKPFELSNSGTIQINQLKATEYWRILLILALIFIGIEILLLKLWKR